MKMIGQNSPATPVPSTACPIGVGNRRASERIGTSVPSAVVASATASNHHVASTPGAVESDADRQPDRQRHAPAHGSRAASISRGTCCSITSRPAKKKSSARPKLDRKVMYSFTVGDIEPLGPDEDPEDDLHHDGRQDRA